MKSAWTGVGPTLTSLRKHGLSSRTRESNYQFGSIPSAEAQIDIADESILMEVNCDCQWNTRGTFNGFWFHDLNDTMPAIIGFSLERSDGLEGLEESDIDFTENEIWGDFRGIRSDDPKGWYFRINVEFIPAPGVPAAMALFALAGLVSRRRKRTRPLT